MTLILDTGPVVALLDANDRDHERCVAMVAELDEDLVIPAPALVEIEYWLRKRYGADIWLAPAEDVHRGAYRLHDLDSVDVLRTAQLGLEYADLGLGFVDAAVVVSCERLGETKVATLDRRHFSVVRTRHCEALRLLPD